MEMEGEQKEKQFRAAAYHNNHNNIPLVNVVKQPSVRRHQQREEEWNASE